MKRIIITISFYLLAQSSIVHAQGNDEFSWEMFLPAIAWQHEFSCADIAGCFSGSMTDNCPGENVTGTIGITINSDCTFSGVSVFGVKISGTIIRRTDTAYIGSGQTDANGCGSFNINCTEQGSSIACSYNYSNGSSGVIQNGSAAQCMPDNRFLTQSLAGSWAFTYQIISTFTDNYYLNINDVIEDPPGSGEYYIFGENDYYDIVVAGYDPEFNDYFLYEPGGSYDAFYFFTYTSTNQVSGCLYLIDNATDAWSECYPMNGERFSSNF